MHAETVKSLAQRTDIGNMDFKFNWMGYSSQMIWNAFLVNQSMWMSFRGGDPSSSKESSNVIPLG